MYSRVQTAGSTHLFNVKSGISVIGEEFQAVLASGFVSKIDYPGGIPFHFYFPQGRCSKQFVSSVKIVHR